MVSVPRRFAGFRTASGVLKDHSLTEAQKRTALLAWRASLQNSPPAGRDGRNQRDAMIREIEAALKKLAT